MTEAQKAVKKELLRYYSKALDELFEKQLKQIKFVEIEAKVEFLSERTLPLTLEKLTKEQGLFPRIM